MAVKEHSMSKSESIGKRIAFLRKNKGFTQEELGVQLNITAQAVSKWEQGLTLPDILLLPVLGKIFAVSIDYLLIGESIKDKKGPYDEAYNKEEYYWGIKESLLAKKVLEVTKTKGKNVKLLDVGAGEGRDAVFFAKHGFQVDALEISKPGVEKIMQYSLNAGCDVDVIHDDMIGFNLIDNYDVIYSHGSLQFLTKEE